ncbi:MAG: zinc ribbon domain-containing protein [Nodosilinea sp.]
MPYQYDLGPGQKIYLDNPGPTTVITLASSSLGQQQQSVTQLQTGPWTEVPEAARVGSGLLIRCVTAQGLFVWKVQGTQIGIADAAVWPTQQAVSFEPATAAMPPMPPMPSMKPMKMGDMQMSANPMTMKMGDMTLSMGTDAPDVTTAETKFCTQCGTAVTASDRFCGSCGHRLQ